jgi:flagellar export protein FliJ
MKRFQFSMQSAMDARTALEQVAAGRVSAVERECREARDRLRVLQEHRAAKTAVLTGAATAGGAGLGEGLRFLERIGAAVTMQARRVATVEERLDVARQTLHATTRERRMMEKLMERELLSWRETQGRREQSEMDEYAVCGYVRRQRVEGGLHAAVPGGVGAAP